MLRSIGKQSEESVESVLFHTAGAKTRFELAVLLCVFRKGNQWELTVCEREGTREPTTPSPVISRRR